MLIYPPKHDLNCPNVTIHQVYVSSQNLAVDQDDQLLDNVMHLLLCCHGKSRFGEMNLF